MKADRSRASNSGDSDSPGADDSPRSAAGNKSASVVALTKNDMFLRSDVAPVDARDFEDRHRHRATSSDQLLARYIKWDEHQTKLRWQRLALGVVALIAFMVLFLIGTAVLVRLVPGLMPREAVVTVSSALFAASGGLTIGGLVTYLVKRRRPR